MNLHRADKKPDWELVPSEERNVWQRLAARTKGAVTPANAVSAAGFLVAAKGLVDISRGKTTRGVAEFAAGRLMDVADGFIADATGTKSPLGEGVDASLDKAVIAGALPVMTRADILPVPAAWTIGVQNGLNFVFTGIAKFRGTDIHTSLLGKLTAASQAGCIASYGASAAAEALGYERSAEVARMLGHGLTAAATVLGAAATAGYARAATAYPEAL